MLTIYSIPLIVILNNYELKRGKQTEWSRDGWGGVGREGITLKGNKKAQIVSAERGVGCFLCPKELKQRALSQTQK